MVYYFNNQFRKMTMTYLSKNQHKNVGGKRASAFAANKINEINGNVIHSPHSI